MNLTLYSTFYTLARILILYPPERDLCCSYLTSLSEFPIELCQHDHFFFYLSLSLSLSLLCL